MSNADQLVNSYLFDNLKTFHGAQWPDQHTFLLKWPLFIAVQLFGATPSAFASLTVATVLLTVSLLALVMYRIEHRPLVFGTLCLALASVLLMVPAQPYSGGILPVNMAMLTTRNIEYMVFIASLALFVYTPRVRHWKFGLGIGLLVLLVASDKLFLSLGVGAAILAMTVYALAGKWPLVKLSARWFAASLVGAVGAVGLLWLINTSGLTHTVAGPLAGPYGYVSNIKDLLLGCIYMILGILTNLGANPANDTRLLADIPRQILQSFTGVEGLAILMNAALVVAACVAVIRLLLSSIARRKTKSTIPHDAYFKLSLMLIWSTVAACGIFAVSKHYYPVDARYVAIVLFTAFIAIATITRTINWQPRRIMLIGFLFCVSIVAGIIATSHTSTAEHTAMDSVTKRNALISKAIEQHHIDTLVGDYWRVLPTRLGAHKNLRVVPLSDCGQFRDTLNSSVWKPDLGKQHFAYLLTLDKSLTGYPACSIDTVIKQYGRPNASTLIAGSLKQPTELLLIYDRGAHSSAPLPSPTKTPSTVLPISVNDLTHTACAGTTTMNIVAHQDDDLLFMSPDLQHSLEGNNCVRTIYVTSGDAGADKYYWVGREQGSEAAYSAMLHTNSIWVERIVKLPTGQFVTVANPRGNFRVSLIFMHLPDGNLQGQGFRSSHHESLASLEAGQIQNIHSIDHQSTFSAEDLSGALTTFMRLYQPTEIRTQANLASRSHPDHSDHMAVGRIAKAAYQSYIDQQFDSKPLIPLTFYTGYPIQNMPANVTGQDLRDKERAFFAYAKYDPSVCSSEEQCSFNSNYGWYLKRQYQNDY